MDDPFVWSLPVLAATAVAAWTDLRHGRISNLLTLPGMLAGFLLSGLRNGTDGLADSLLGWAALGGMMAVSLTLCPGVGGGDVKLLAMMGAFLGLEGGMEVLLWTCVLAVSQVIVRLCWKAGPRNALRAVRAALFGQSKALSEADREAIDRLLVDRLRLGPAALGALLILLAERQAGWLE